MLLSSSMAAIARKGRCKCCIDPFIRDHTNPASIFTARCRELRFQATACSFASATNSPHQSSLATFGHWAFMSVSAGEGAYRRHSLWVALKNLQLEQLMGTSLVEVMVSKCAAAAWVPEKDKKFQIVIMTITRRSYCLHFALFVASRPRASAPRLCDNTAHHQARGSETGRHPCGRRCHCASAKDR